MTSIISKLWTRLCSKRRPLSIMIIGLDDSGKTSILNSLTSLNNRTTSSTKSQESSPESSTTRTFSKATSENADVGHSKSLDQSSGNIMPTVGYSYERVLYKGLTVTVLDFSGQNRYRSLWQEFYSSVDAIVFVIDSSDLIRLVVVRDELETMLCDPYFNSLSSQHLNGQPSDTSMVQKQITISQGKLIQSAIENNLSSMSTPNRNSQSQAPKQSNQNKLTSMGRRIKVPILFLANKSDLPSSVDTEVIGKALNLNQLSVERHPWFIQATSVKLNQGLANGFDWLFNQLIADC